MLGDIYSVDGKYDRIFTDEMLVHDPDHEEFFQKCKELLNEDGLIVHKELHLRDEKCITLDRCIKLNETFNFTGRYRVLDYDLECLNNVGFKTTVYPIEIDNYEKTLASWVSKMAQRKEEMIAIDEERYYRDLETWELFLTILAEGLLKVNIMVSYL